MAATCQNCGSELSGPYCNTCGARAPEERAAKKKETHKAPARPAAGRGGSGLFSPNRIGRTTAMGLLGLLLFGAGTVTGYWLASSTSSAGALTSTTLEASSGDTATDAQLTPLGQAGDFMDQGVDLLNKGDRAGAVAAFRKSITQFETALKTEPDNLYAKSYLGLTYYYAGDSKKALDLENEVLKADDKYLWAIFNLAWMYESANKQTESVMMYKKYLSVVDSEKQNQLKYAEQYELIDKQVEAAQKAVADAEGGGKK